MSVNRKAVVIYGSTDLWIYWDKADKLRLFYRDISHNLCAKWVAEDTKIRRQPNIIKIMLPYAYSLSFRGVLLSHICFKMNLLR